MQMHNKSCETDIHKQKTGALYHIYLLQKMKETKGNNFLGSVKRSLQTCIGRMII